MIENYDAKSVVKAAKSETPVETSSAEKIKQQLEYVNDLITRVLGKANTKFSIYLKEEKRNGNMEEEKYIPYSTYFEELRRINNDTSNKIWELDDLIERLDL